MSLTARTLYEAVSALNRAAGFQGGAALNALGTTVQFWHETGGFSSRPMMENRNLAGIVCTRSWTDRGGRCFSSRTWEQGAKGKVTLVRGFRSYPSLTAFLADYSRLIVTYYPVSARNPDCVWGYLAGLQNGRKGRRWATDPHYLEKLFRLVRDLAPQLLGPEAEALLESSRRAFFDRGLDRFSGGARC
jgi:hypothetical protein